MLQTDNSVLLWRVDLVHRNGYLAPSGMLEAKRSNVHQEVRNQHYRLMDFPKSWSYHLTVISRDYDAKRRKWIINCGK
jgi:hypothetical protein